MAETEQDPSVRGKFVYVLTLPYLITFMLFFNNNIYFNNVKLFKKMKVLVLHF